MEPIFPMFAQSEPTATALFSSVLGLLIAVSVLFSRAVDRLGVPIVLLFLVLGMLGGSEGIGGIEFDNYGTAVRLGTIALVLILFDGGLNTSVASVREVLYPAGVLATVGVVLTAALVALSARLFGLPWSESLLLGAVVSSTDAAAVFAVLRGGRLHLEPKLGRTLEVESCVNDPMAVILTTSLIQVMQSDEPVGWRLLASVPLQLFMGGVVGAIVGYVARALLRRVRLTTAGLYPALTLAMALLSFGVATLAWGSGFLAVFVTGLLLGNGPLPNRSGLARIHDALAWLSQIGMFLMLGLLVFPSRLPDVAWAGLGVGLALALVARPLAVVICLLPFRYPRAYVGYASWVGLRGAVPIILATFPVLAGVQHAERIFNLVFFLVVVSSIVPGATVRWVTRRFGLNVPEPPTPAAILEINATHPLNGELVSYHVEPSLAVCGAKLSEIEFPPNSSVVLVVRGKDLVPARGDTVLMPDDHAYVFFRHADRAFIELLFGGPES
jgi:cell volume regulation protein A